MNDQVAVVIPSFRVKRNILDVIGAIGPEVARIYVVDDCCPEGSGRHVEEKNSDSRVTVLYHQKNQGVGGATMTGYQQAMNDGCDIMVKIDGDGQMDPRLIPSFIAPIVSGLADYTKGNRFFSLDYLQKMPRIRLIGNAGLSFITKASSGYWNLMDPTNGFTAIHRSTLSFIPLKKLDKRYFFESDLLFRLNTLRAVVQEVPMEALYKDEKSSMNVFKVLFEFPCKHLVRAAKRIFYNYFLRDFNVCSIELIFGLILLTFGVSFGFLRWYEGSITGVANPVGTVMLASVPVIIGVQLLLAALSYDVMNVPRTPIQSLYRTKER